MKKRAVIVILTILSTLLSMTAPFSIYAAETSNVSSILIQGSTEYSDVSFQFAMKDTVDLDNSVAAFNTAMQYSNYYLSCSGLEYPQSSGSTTYDTSQTCKIIRGSSSTAVALTMVNAAHMEDITGTITEAFTSTVRYSYSADHYYQIAFNDNKLHTGVIHLAAGEGTGLISDNEDVAVIGDDIYIYSKGAFVLRKSQRQTNKTTLATVSRPDLTVNSIEEASNVFDASSIVAAIQSASSINHADLEQLIQTKQWNIPVESFTAVKYYEDAGYNQSGFNTLNYYNYPIFDIQQGNKLAVFYLSSGVTGSFIFYINKNISSTNFSNWFTSSGDLSYSYYTIDGNYSGSAGRFIKLTVSLPANASSGFFSIEYSNAAAAVVMPIYMGRSSDSLGMSNDFALNWGFSNSMLDDIDHISGRSDQIYNETLRINDYLYGGSQDNIVANNLVNQKSTTLVNQADQVEAVEEEMREDFTNAMQDLPTSNFTGGTRFYRAAQWVATQFNTIASTSNPIGQFLVFTLVIGISLLIIGKLR